MVYRERRNSDLIGALPPKLFASCKLEDYQSGFPTDSLPIRDNVADEETMDEGLEVGIDVEDPDGIQCVNCGVWGRLSHFDFRPGQTRARPRIRIDSVCLTIQSLTRITL